MHLIEFLLPVAGPNDFYENLARTLTDRFGGLTSFTRAPAEGRWQNAGSVEHDDLIVIEVMAPRSTRTGGRSYGPNWSKNLNRTASSSEPIPLTC
jgi:hypothetical protein